MATLLTSFFSGVFDVARNELQAGRFIEELEKGIALAKIIGWRWKPEDRDAIEKKISGMIRSMRRRFTNIQSLVLKENFDELMVDWTSLKEKLEGITTPSTKDVADVYKERERRKHLNVVKEEITGGSVDPVMNEAARQVVEAKTEEEFFDKFFRILKNDRVSNSAMTALALSELFLMSIRVSCDNRYVDHLCQAVSLLEKAEMSGKGAQAVQLKLFLCRQYGIGVEKDEAGASRVLENFKETIKQADKVEADAFRAISSFWKVSIPGVKDGDAKDRLLAVANSLLQKYSNPVSEYAPKLGEETWHKNVFLLLGVTYIQEGSKPESVKWLRHAANLMSGTAHLILSYLYLHEDNKDMRKALGLTGDETGELDTEQTIPLSEIHYMIGSAIYEESDPIAHCYLGVLLGNKKKYFEQGEEMFKSMQWGYRPVALCRRWNSWKLDHGKEVLREAIRRHQLVETMLGKEKDDF